MKTQLYNVYTPAVTFISNFFSLIIFFSNHPNTLVETFLAFLCVLHRVRTLKKKNKRTQTINNKKSFRRFFLFFYWEKVMKNKKKKSDQWAKAENAVRWRQAKLWRNVIIRRTRKKLLMRTWTEALVNIHYGHGKNM